MSFETVALNMDYLPAMLRGIQYVYIYIYHMYTYERGQGKTIISIFLILGCCCVYGVVCM